MKLHSGKKSSAHMTKNTGIS